MAKRIIALLTLILCLMAAMPLSVPTYAASVNIAIENPNWGVIDGETIKNIPHLLSVERFLGNIYGMYGAGITKELYMPDGETPVTSGDITDGMKLKVKTSSAETVYELKLMRKLTEPGLLINSATEYVWPSPNEVAPELPTHGVYVFEGALKLTEYRAATVTVAIEGDRWMRPLYFTPEGYITQTTSKNFVVQVPYELNKDYQYVAMVDLDNKKYWLYINGVLVSEDKVNGDSHSNIYPGARLERISMYRPMSYFEFYVIPSVEDFDITPYICNLSSNHQDVLVDKEKAKIMISDDSIVTKKDLFDTFVFSDEKAKEKVKLFNAMNEEVTVDSTELKDSFKVRVISENGLAKLEYSIDTGRPDPNILNEDSSDYKKFAFLKKLELFNKTEEVAYGINVSRGNFARYLTKLASLKVTDSTESQFSDVVSGSTLAGYVNAVSSAGYMSGKGNGEFGVNSKITYNEAITALVRVAGYEQLAQARGGYPEGYIYAAKTANMLKGVEIKGNESLTKLDAVKLFYNTLLAPYNDITSVSEDYSIYATYRDMTVLRKLHGIIKGEGHLTTNQFTDIHTGGKTTAKGKVSIDGVLYNVPASSDYENYLGMRVDFFYEEDTNAPYNIVFMAPSQDADSLEITAENISKILGKTLEYYDENDNVDDCELADGFSFIFNGKLDSGRTMSDLQITDGKLTLIDSDGSGTYDVVLANVPTVYDFEGANANKGIIYTTTEEIAVDEEKCNIILTDEYGNGSKILMKDIPYPSVLTMYRSKDGACANMYVTTNAVTSSVTEKRADSVVINSRGYTFIPSFDISTVELGTNYDFRFDALGRIAFVETATMRENYGYLVGFGQEQGLDTRPKLRIVTAPEESADYTVAEKLTLNGVKVESNALKNHPALFTGGAVQSQLVKYTLDINSEIKSIESNLVGESVSGEYMVTGGLNLLAGSYIITSETYFLTVPVEDERSDAKLYRKPEFNDNQQYSVTVYDVNEDTRKAGAVIQFATESVSGNAPVGIGAQWGIVESVAMGMNAEGEVTNLVSVMHGGEIKKLFVNAEHSSTNADLQFGDVIRFTLNARQDTMLNYTLEFRVESDGTSYEIIPHTSSSEYNQRYGMALGRQDKYIIMNDEVNCVEIIAPIISGRSYKVDFAEETITAAKAQDYMPNQMGVYARGYRTMAPTVIVGYVFE